MNLDTLYQIIQQREKSKEKNSYVVEIFKKGKDAMLQKIGEEAVEVILAAKNSSKKNIIWEVSDLFFMSLLLLNYFKISLDDIYKELERRNKQKTTFLQSEGNGALSGEQQA